MEFTLGGANCELRRRRRVAVDMQCGRKTCREEWKYSQWNWIGKARERLSFRHYVISIQGASVDDRIGR